MTTQFYVPEIACQHCVNAVTKEVSALDGIQQVDVEIDTKTVMVKHSEGVSVAAIIDAINEAGYDDVSQINV